MSRRILTPCWLALLAAGFLHGQAELATITGIVTDAAKAVVPGVKITVRNTETDIVHTAATNAEGYYTVPELPAGPYVLEATIQGFETFKENGLVLETGQERRVDIPMKVGSVSDSVEVTADVAV